MQHFATLLTREINTDEREVRTLSAYIDCDSPPHKFIMLLEFHDLQRSKLACES